MKTDKYGIEIKVGDFVYIDALQGMEYGTSAGTIQQIKKIGSRRIHFNSGHTNPRKAQFNYITKYSLISIEGRSTNNEYSKLDHTFYYPLFVRTATNDQMYNAIVKGLKSNVNETNKDISDALIKNETYKYENKLVNYKLKNSGYGFGVIWQKKDLDLTHNGVSLINVEIPND